MLDPSVVEAAASLSRDTHARMSPNYTSQVPGVSLSASRADSIFTTHNTTQLTLDALELSLADTGAAMEADFEMGALSLQSLGLNQEDLEEGQVVGAPEDIAERMSRILDTFGTNVGATADFVLVSQAMEPGESYTQPPPELRDQEPSRQQNMTETHAREGGAARPQRDAGQENLQQALREKMASRIKPPLPRLALPVRAASPLAPTFNTLVAAARSELPATLAPEQGHEHERDGNTGATGISLDDLGLDLQDVSGGAGNIDDSVLRLAKQLAEENDSPR